MVRDDHDLVVAVVVLLVATQYGFICTSKEAAVVVVVIRKHQDLVVDERRVEDLDFRIRVRLLRVRSRIADQVEDFDVAVFLASRAV